MRKCQGHLLSALFKKPCVLCLVVPLTMHHPNIELFFQAESRALASGVALPKARQLLYREHTLCARLLHTLGSFAARSNATTKREGSRGATRNMNHSMAAEESRTALTSAHDAVSQRGAKTATGFAWTWESPGFEDHHGFSQEGHSDGGSFPQSMSARTQSKAAKRFTTRIGPEARHLGSAEYTVQHQHSTTQQLEHSVQQYSLQDRQLRSSLTPHARKQLRLRWLSDGGKNVHKEATQSDRSTTDAHEDHSLQVQAVTSGVKEKHLNDRTGWSAVSQDTKEKLEPQAAGELAELVANEQYAKAIQENNWTLIEESWKRAELLYNNSTAFFSSGFQVHMGKDSRIVIQAVMPFWKVDLLGALHDMAKMNAWRASGMPAAPPARPLLLRGGRAGNDTLMEISYSPSWQRNTYVFGWNGTQITYSTGVDPMEAWPLERIGGDASALPSSHLMEITSGHGEAKAFHDLSSRFYGNDINIGDVGVGVRHQFFDDTYNATPSNVVVKAQNYSVNISGDPTDTNYRVGIGNDNTKFAVSRDFDERRTAFRGEFMDWMVSWESDAQDANSSTVSADAVVGSKNEEPFLTAHLRRGEAGESAEMDAQIQMRDMGVRMQWKEEGLTGDITLGNIKYKLGMREGLPDFTLTPS